MRWNPTQRLARGGLILALMAVSAVGSAAVPAGAVDAPAVLATHADAQLGTFLTDAKGMTLYLFTKDVPGISNCYDQCAVNWPPLLSQGDPVLPDGLAGAIVSDTSLPLPTVNPGHNSGNMWITEASTSPSSGILIEASISKCKGVIDTGNGSCYLRSQMSNFNSIMWLANNPAGYSQALLDSMGVCNAPASQGPWFLNIRFTYQSCNIGVCGESLTWYDGWL